MKPWENFQRNYPKGFTTFKTKSGYTGVIRQIPNSLHLCGYVIVPKEHPFYGKDYDENEIYDLEVHGGVTFTNELLNMGYAIGFDCNHIGDLSPLMVMTGFNIPGDTYKDEVYVRNEIENLAKQIKENEHGITKI